MNGVRRGLMDGDLCVAFAVVIVAQREGWTPEQRPTIFPWSSPMPLSQNNSIRIHQSCICAPGSRPQSWSEISPPHQRWHLHSSTQTVGQDSPC